MHNIKLICSGISLISRRLIMDNKKYIKPEAEIIEFSKEDIIVTSGGDEQWGGLGGVDGSAVPFW